MRVDRAEGKKPFDIDVAMERIAAAVEPYPKAAMFELAERGFGTPFEQLVACVISIRTRDEESLPISTPPLRGRAPRRRTSSRSPRLRSTP